MSLSKFLIGAAVAVPLAVMAYRAYQSRYGAGANPKRPANYAASKAIRPVAVTSSADLLALRQWVGSEAQFNAGEGMYTWNLLNNVLNGSLQLDVHVKIWVDDLSSPNCVFTLYRSLYFYTTCEAALIAMLSAGILPKPVSGQLWVGSIPDRYVPVIKTTGLTFAPPASDGGDNKSHYGAEVTYEGKFWQYRIDKASEFTPAPAPSTRKSHSRTVFDEISRDIKSNASSTASTAAASAVGGANDAFGGSSADHLGLVVHPTTKVSYHAIIRRLHASDAKRVDDDWTYRNPSTLPFVTLLISQFPAYGVRLYPVSASAPAAAGVVHPHGVEDTSELVSWNISTDYSGSGLQFTKPEWRGFGFANRLVERHVRSHHIIKCNRSPAAVDTPQSTAIIPYPLTTDHAPIHCDELSAAAHAELMRMARPYCWIATDNVASLANSAKVGYQKKFLVQWLGLKLIQPTPDPTAAAAATAAPAKQC